MNNFDVIVVGAGVNGLATAWYLVYKERKRVLLLEQFAFPHTCGSSHGHSRITGLLSVDTVSSCMLKDTFELWREIEQLLTRAVRRWGLTDRDYGCVCLGSEEVMEKIINYASSNNADINSLKFDDLLTKFPQFKSYKGFCADKCLYDENGGILFADKCLRALKMIYPNDGYILDIHPLYSNIIFGTGFSGYGFKTAPVVAKLLSGLTLNKHSGYDPKQFLLSKVFNQSKSKTMKILEWKQTY